MKTILFDIDGTLLNTDTLIMKAYLHLFDTFRNDYHVSQKELTSFLGPTLKEVFPKYFKEDFEVLLHEYHQYSKEHIRQFVHLYDGVEEMLKSFKKENYTLGIITNRFRYSFEEVLSPFQIATYFDVMVTLDDIQNAKPDPEGILLAMKKLNATKEDTLYVGDNESDYKASKNARIKSALVNWSLGRNNALLNPDYLITSFKEFQEVILHEGN